jgi:hypothetical protein
MHEGWCIYILYIKVTEYISTISGHWFAYIQDTKDEMDPDYFCIVQDDFITPVTT